MGDQRREPVDLVINIETPWGPGKPTLSFLVTSPSGLLRNYDNIKLYGPSLNDPEGFKERIFKRFEQLQAKRTSSGSISGKVAAQEFEWIGHQLFVKLFPKALHTSMIENGVKSLVIYSNEPWIPWEILRAYDNEFFCMKFSMSRWLTPTSDDGFLPHLVPHKEIEHLLAISAGAKEDLQNVDDELTFLSHLVKSQTSTFGLQTTVRPGSVTEEFSEDIKSRPFQLLHFAGHGEHGRKLILEDGELKQGHFPSSSKFIAKIREDSPLIFFNACQAGQVQTSIAGLEGFPAFWILTLGCSGYIAPTWSVNDDRAFEFAKAFYNYLLKGETLGEAVRLARHSLRDTEKHEMTWLAYSLFGHPNAEIVFGLSSKRDSSQNTVLVEPTPQVIADDVPTIKETAADDGSVSEEPVGGFPNVRSGPRSEPGPKPGPHKNGSIPSEKHWLDALRSFRFSLVLCTIGLCIFLYLHFTKVPTQVRLDLVVSHAKFTMAGENAQQLFDTHLDLRSLTLNAFGRFEMTPAELRALGDDASGATFSRSLELGNADQLVLNAQQRGAYISLESRQEPWHRALNRLYVEPETVIDLHTAKAPGNAFEVSVEWSSETELPVVLSTAPFFMEADGVDASGSSALADEEIYWMASLPENNVIITVFPDQENKLHLTAAVSAERAELLSKDEDLYISAIDLTYWDGDKYVTSLAQNGKLIYPDSSVEPIGLLSTDLLGLDGLDTFRISKMNVDPETGFLHLSLDGIAGSVRSGPKDLTEERTLSLLQRLKAPPWILLAGWLAACFTLAQTVEKRIRQEP